MENERSQTPCAAFFCPQSRAPQKEHLAELHGFLRNNHYGQLLLQNIVELDNTWKIFADAEDGVEKISQGLSYVSLLTQWARDGLSDSLAEARSGIVALPLMVVLQITQYFQFLEFRGLSHKDFIAGVQDGGLQGYCSGLPSAIAIACSIDETDVVKNAVTAMRILLGVGAYGEMADDSKISGSTTLVLRVKYPGQGDELARGFPGVRA